MTSSLDQLLAKARLVPAPYTQAEIEAAVERVAARVGARLRPGGRTPHPATPRPEGIPAPQRGREAAQNLRHLRAIGLSAHRDGDVFHLLLRISSR